ncbi:class I SAM-dependent methyltransferase [Nocardioides abyssi]|uniref:Class I SAM-dependent methyltransferase n=1 Tax=Nocardioides abyssi TaxID=3058370 RepID=A0ABT8EWR9_9ACTN|nr:class I SAM-dependent methyltransferase [Nocardioides abyssi]MDN4162631.1 class I SAM-dependent methyltransferase [Nocardioides abyssi]
MAEAPPPTRWALAGPMRGGYGENFARLVASGADVDGEARLADALLPRGARVLDVGSGMGRVAAALVARGHDVTAVEPDAELVAQSRRTYPDLAVVEADVLAVSPDDVGTFDLVVCVGNVLVFLAEGTERRVLAHLRSLLAPGGRVLAGFHLRGGPAAARRYPPEELVADAGAAGLRVDLRAGSYELHPANEEYAVWLLSADPAAAHPAG